MAAYPRPLIAITTDVHEPSIGKVRAQSSMFYADAVWSAGGHPVLLPAIVDAIPYQLSTFDAFVLTGGDDPRMESFGEPSHPKITPLHQRRQEYEIQLIRTLLAQPATPILGICLGMQMLALCAGGTLEQHLPDRLLTADEHRHEAVHGIVPSPGSTLPAGCVTSSHKQAVSCCPTGFRIAAMSHDGVIEAIESCDSQRSFCLGVQWHPERTADAQLGQGIFQRLIAAARLYAESRR